jgi:hypothetical protein
MPQTLVLEDVVASAMDASLASVWTAMPAVIESYDANLQRANLQIVVKSGSVGEDGERITETIAVNNSVPVIHIGGSGFRSYFPPARGDTALLVFASRSIGAWLAKGGIVDTGQDHHHDLSDAIAIVGLRDFAHSLKNAPSDHASIGHDEGATIEFRQSEIRVGGDIGTQPTIMATSYRSHEDTYFSAVNALLTDLAAVVSTLATAAPSFTNPGGVAAFTAAVAALATAISSFAGVVATFNGASSTYLTQVAKVK